MEHTPETTPPDTNTAQGEAQGATRDASRLESELAELRRTLARAREALDHAERRHLIELELLKAEAVDLETARLLTEVAVAAAPAPDIARAVADLRARKPFLFRRRTNLSAMAPAGGSDALESLAREARTLGDRRSLLRYLRARRAAGAGGGAA